MALNSNFWVILVLWFFFFSHFQFKLAFQMRCTKFLSRSSRNFFYLSVLLALQPRLAIWLSALGGSKPRISNKLLMFQSLAHFMWRNRLKQTVLVFLVTQNSHCYTNTFNLPFLGLNWIQVGRDESKRCTNLLLQLLLLTLSYVSSDSLWFLLKLLLLFLNLTIRHSLLFFFYYEKALSPPFSQLFPHGKRTQNYSIMISMCGFNFSLGGFSDAEYKWADKQHFIAYSSAKDLQNKLRSERRIRVRLMWRASVALQSILDFLQVHTCNLSSVVLVRGGFPESVTEMGML